MSENISERKFYRTVVITFLDLPPDKPPIEKIISLSGVMSEELSLNILPRGRLNIAGNLTFSTLYQEENELSEGKMQQLEHEMTFDYLFSLEEIGQLPQIFAEIEYLNYELLDSNTIELEIIFGITALR